MVICELLNNGKRELRGRQRKSKHQKPRRKEGKLQLAILFQSLVLMPGRDMETQCNHTHTPSGLEGCQRCGGTFGSRGWAEVRLPFGTRKKQSQNFRLNVGRVSLMDRPSPFLPITDDKGRSAQTLVEERCIMNPAVLASLSYQNLRMTTSCGYHTITAQGEDDSAMPPKVLGAFQKS